MRLGTFLFWVVMFAFVDPDTFGKWIGDISFAVVNQLESRRWESLLNEPEGQ